MRASVRLRALLSDSDDAVATRPASLRAAALGRPPRDLHRLHDPRLIGRWDAAIRACIADPIATDDYPAGRYVQVLGQIVLRCARDGTITPFLWTLDAALEYERVGTDQINLVGMPYGWRWLDLFRKAFEKELARRLGADEPGIAAYARWVFQRIRAGVRRDCDLHRMRLRVAQAIALDDWAAAIARRIELASHPGVSVRISTYNEVVSHRADYEKLERESPGLVILFSVLRPTLTGTGEPAARLRRRVLGMGVAPATWRVLHRGTGRYARLLAEFYSGQGVVAARDLLRIVDLLAPSAQPPNWFLRAVLHGFGYFGQRRPQYVELLRPFAVPLRRLMALAERAGAAETADIHENLYRVVTWLDCDPDAGRHPYARRARWRWFKRRADAWHEREERKAKCDTSAWPTPIPAMQCEGVEVVALCTPFALWEEGRTMRHCAPSMEADCREGTALIFSIRRPDRVRPLATMHVVWDDAWWLYQIVGCANTAAPPVALRVAGRVVDLINAIGWPPGGADAAATATPHPALAAGRGAADNAVEGSGAAEHGP